MQENMVCVSCQADAAIVEKMQKLCIPVVNQSVLTTVILQHRGLDQLKL